MRKILIFFLLFTIGSVCIFADDELSNDSEPVQDNSNDTTPVVVDITQLVNSISSNDRDDQDENKITSVEIVEPELVNVSSTLQKISAEDSSGFKAVMLSILGDYETVVTDYEYRNNNNTYYSHSITIERDWAWICSCGVFALLLYCTYRAIGGICARF